MNTHEKKEQKKVGSNLVESGQLGQDQMYGTILSEAQRVKREKELGKFEVIENIAPKGAEKSGKKNKKMLDRWTFRPKWIST